MRNMNNISELVKYAFVTLLGTLCLAGCGQDEKIGLNATDSVAPGLPTNIEVENINGGAIIRYTPPKDDDLLCVVASYMINGVERTTKASPYVDSLIVEGFGKVGDYNIFLKSVDKSQNESEPKTVSISPLTPPVEYIYESLKITDSFGGVSLTWKNPTRQNIILEVTKKENGEWVSLENFYSSIVEGQAKIRGLAAEPITLGYRIRDRWDNYSEMLELESNPLYEEELDKSKFKELPTHLIFDELGTTFITPFDREDIHDLASCMDDVIDGINSCAKRISIYNPRPISESGKELSRLIQEEAIYICKAMDELETFRKKPTLLREYCSKLHEIENQADDVYEFFITRLFEEEKDCIELIKIKEIMHELEKTTDAAEHVGKILKSLIVKYA